MAFLHFFTQLDLLTRSRFVLKNLASAHAWLTFHWFFVNPRSRGIISHKKKRLDICERKKNANNALSKVIYGIKTFLLRASTIVMFLEILRFESHDWYLIDNHKTSNLIMIYISYWMQIIMKNSLFPQIPKGLQHF